MTIELLPTGQLETKRDRAEAAGDWPLFERCEAELERRDYDASDPACVAEREQRAADSEGL
jgi:hypothetical protein